MPRWNTTADGSDPRIRVPGLIAEGMERLVIQASPQLARTLRGAGLVDWLRLLLQPIVAATGPDLFGADEHYDPLVLESVRATASGAVALDYLLKPQSK